MSRNRISKNELNDELKNDIYAVASTDNLGKIKVDGTTFKVDNEGVISIDLKNQELAITPSLNVGFIYSIASSIYPPITYFKDSFGIVHVNGCVESTSNNSTPFNLPVGYRPSKRIVFPTSRLVDGKNEIVWGGILSNGDCVVTTLSGNISQINVSYLAEN